MKQVKCLLSECTVCISVAVPHTIADSTDCWGAFLRRFFFSGRKHSCLSSRSKVWQFTGQEAYSAWCCLNTCSAFIISPKRMAFRSFLCSQTHTLCVCGCVCVVFHRAIERAAGGVCQQALPGPHQNSAQSEERGTHPCTHRRLESGHWGSDRLLWCPRRVHSFLVRLRQLR